MAKIEELRVAFAADKADDLALAAEPKAVRRPRARGWTNHAVWFDSDDSLVAVVGEQESRRVDAALAHGLFHAQALGRTLTLVLPQDWSAPTRRRLPWIDYDVKVWTYDSAGHIHLTDPISREQVIRSAGDHEASPALHLDDRASDRIRQLTEWAAGHPDLEAAHLKHTRVWSCNGQRVLTIKGNAKTTVTAGVDAKSDPARVVTLTRSMTSEQFEEIKDYVQLGIRNAQGRKFGSFDEHRLQQRLRAEPRRLLLEHPLLREVPAWRPIGGDGTETLGRGFVDLAGLDSIGDLVIVETKLGADDMLILQGLDYWIWAQRETNRNWLIQRLHGHPAHAKTRLLYAIAGKNQASPVVDRYCKSHLAVLTPDIAWRFALITDWDTPSIKVDVLDPYVPPSEAARRRPT